MKLAWVKWRDASHGLEEWDVSRMTLSELEEVGFLLREDDESITLGMEHAADATTARRMWLTIPRGQILDMRVRDLDKAFPARKRRKS
jgi:hypothetical protein